MSFLQQLYKQAIVDPYNLDKSDIKIITLNDINKYFGRNLYNTILQDIKLNVDEDFDHLFRELHYQRRSIKELENLRLENFMRTYLAFKLRPRIDRILQDNGKSCTLSLDAYSFEQYDFIQRAFKKTVQRFINANGLIMSLKETIRQDERLANQFKIVMQATLNKLFDKAHVQELINKCGDYNEIMKLDWEDVFYAYSPLIINALMKLPINKQVFENTLESSLIAETLDLVRQYHFDVMEFWRNFNEIVKPLTHEQLQDLMTVKDKIGQDHHVNINCIDVNNRDKPCIIVNGELIIGNNMESHAQVISRIKKEPEKFLRYDIDTSKFNSLAFGHIVDRLCFFEEDSIHGNLSITHALSILKPNFDKVYSYPKNRMVTRLAKRIK